MSHFLLPVLRLLLIAVVVFPWGSKVQGQAPDKRQDYSVFEPSPQRANGLKVVFLAGDEEYRSEEAFPMLAKILAKHHGFHCTVLFPINPETGEIDPNNQVNIPHLDLLDQADLVIMGWRFRHPPAESMQHFLKYLQAGKPIIGIRTSTHAFAFPGDAPEELRRLTWNAEDWPGGFGKQILGETWVSHHGNHGGESTRGVIEPENSEHPILRGVNDVWGPTDVYGINQLPADAKVLLRGQVLAGMQPDAPPVDGEKNNPLMPLVWAREISAAPGLPTGRYVCSTIGAAEDFSSPGLRRLLVNACYWCTGRESDIRPEMSVEFAAPYEPTRFGFNAFQTGRTPRDYDIPRPDLASTPSEQTESLPMTTAPPGQPCRQLPTCPPAAQSNFRNSDRFWTSQLRTRNRCSSQNWRFSTGSLGKFRGVVYDFTSRK